VFGFNPQVKQALKKKKFNLLKDYDENSKKKFWVMFTNDNLLPPMKFNHEETNESVDFRSFNISYMIWLFTKAGSKYLYDLFICNHGENIMSILKEISEEIDSDKATNEFCLEQVKHYIFNMPEIYYVNESTLSHSYDSPNLTNFDEPWSKNIENKRKCLPCNARTVGSRNNLVSCVHSNFSNDEDSNKLYDEYLVPDFGSKEKDSLFCNIKEFKEKYGGYERKVEDKNENYENVYALMNKQSDLEYFYNGDQLNLLE